MANVISGEITVATSEEAAYARTNERIDNIISAATVDTEIIDIRVGADGKKYATAGNAVRVNIGNLKSAFDSVTISESEFAETNFDSTVNDKYISSNGTQGTINGGIYGAITIHTGEKYKIKAEVGTNIRTYVIADANGTVTRYADAETYNTKHNYNVEITITSAEDGGVLYVSSIHYDYFGLKKEQKSYAIDEEKLQIYNDVADLLEQIPFVLNIEAAVDAVVEQQTVYATTSFDSTVNDKYMSKDGTEGSYSGGCYGAITVHTGEKYKIKAEVGTNIRTYVIADANGTVTRYADAETFHTRHDYDVEITITSAEDGGTLYVSSIVPSYFGLKKKTDYYIIKEEAIPYLPENPLKDKTAVFDGDSICAGLTVGSSDPTYGYGWAGRIGTKNNMTWKNYGVSGGTVTTDTYSWTSVPAAQVDYSSGQTYYRRVGSSASGTDTMYVVVPENEWDGTSGLFVRGSARHWEATNVDTMYAEYPDADYVILESCLNDAFNSVPKGTVVDDNFEPTTTTTFASAMEYMINRAITLFPNAKIGVIIPHREYHSTSVEPYNQITRTVCEKWSIPYIDLYKESGICVNNQTQKAVMFADNTHLTAAGYDMIASKIEAWMKNL